LYIRRPIYHFDGSVKTLVLTKTRLRKYKDFRLPTPENLLQW